MGHTLKHQAKQKESRSNQALPTSTFGKAYLQGETLKVKTNKDSVSTALKGSKTAFQKPKTILHNAKTMLQPETGNQSKSGAYIEQYYRRAKDLVAKQSFSMAVVELRDALKLDPNNSRCHSLLGEVYFKQNQFSMARIHFDRALKLDPHNEAALEGRQKLALKSSKAGRKVPLSKGKRNKQNNNSGGILSNWFGGGKK